MLVPKTSAATTAVIATVVPTSALRTGTAVRPRPGSNAIRTPAAPGTDPARPRADPSRDGRAGAAGSATPSGLGARAAARKTPGSSNASGSRTVATKPAPRIARFTSIPGSGSAGAVPRVCRATPVPYQDLAMKAAPKQGCGHHP